MTAWCEQGLPPSDFWQQTPRTFLAIMRGRALAAKSEYELALYQAWHGEAFARAKKLESLKHYLPSEGAGEPVQPEVILDAMMTMQAHGVPMNIRKLH